MELYIIRHADAGTQDPKKYPDDSLRPLSIDGKSEMLKNARGMRRLGIEFDAIIDSGYVRARQTSECICDAYEIDPATIKTMEELRPEADPAKTVAALRKLRGAQSAALVGHLPHLSRLVGFLIADDPDVEVDFKKGGMCRVDVARFGARGGSLVSMLPPKVLRRLGK